MTPVSALYDTPFALTGKIDKITLDLKEPPETVAKHYAGKIDKITLDLKEGKGGSISFFEKKQKTFHVISSQASQRKFCR